MPTPSKPLQLVTKHLTKAEIEMRAEAEKTLISGERMREWRSTRDSKIAHSHWKRLSKLYANIEKNDALIESVLNRYCLLLAECEEFEGLREHFESSLKKLEDSCGDINPKDHFKLVVSMQKNIMSVDRQISNKRKMLLDIERENIMTLAAQMRSIPKKVQEAEKKPGIAEWRAKRADGS